MLGKEKTSDQISWVGGIFHIFCRNAVSFEIAKNGQNLTYIE